MFHTSPTSPQDRRSQQLDKVRRPAVATPRPHQGLSPSRRAVLMALAGAGAAAVVGGQPAAAAGVPPWETTVDYIYLLIGQSNMAGRAPIEDQDREVVPGAYLFDPSERWTPVSNAPLGLNRYSTVETPRVEITRLGPGYTFARTLSEATGRKVGLVVNAKGGTSISQWRKQDPAGVFPLYAEAVRRTRAALLGTPSARLRGIIWHQGESDNRAGVGEYYLPALRRMVDQLREDLQARSAVFVAGEVGTWQGRGAYINPVLRTISDQIKNSALVTSEGLTTHETTTVTWGPHFDSASQRTFGRRYAEAVLDLHSPGRRSLSAASRG